MALRIGGAKRPPMEEEIVEQEMPVEEMPVEEELPVEEEIPVEEPMMEEAEGHLVDQVTSGYLGPEHGPFMCGNCTHYMGDGACNIVAGPIDEMGCCNLFVSAQQAQAEEEMPMEEELPMEEEVPMEEPPVEDEGY